MRKKVKRMRYIKIAMTSFFASVFGCFLTLGATNEDLAFPAVVVFIAWLTLFIMTIFEEDSEE